MKAKAIQITVILMILTFGAITSVNSQNNNVEKTKVWTSFTLKGDNQVNLRLIKPAGLVVTINVYDNTRQKVFTKKIRKSDNILLTHDISEFPAGVYTYEIIEGKELVKSCKIVKSTGSDLEYFPMGNVAEARK